MQNRNGAWRLHAVRRWLDKKGYPYPTDMHIDEIAEGIYKDVCRNDRTKWIDDHHDEVWLRPYVDPVLDTSQTVMEAIGELIMIPIDAWNDLWDAIRPY